MASLRKLNRRLARWYRYARRTYWSPRVTPPTWQGRRASIAFGHRRAWDAREKERERRQCHTLYGPGMDDGPCDCFDCTSPDDYRCCDAGDDDHPGPCVTTCTGCYGAGRCPYCGGEDDLGCSECDGSGSCPDCWGQGEHVEDVYIGPPIVTVDTGGLT